MKNLLITTLIVVSLSPVAFAQQEPKAKMLSVPEDPRQKTVLVGRSEESGMIVQFEIEPAKAMLMGAPSKQVAHSPAAGEVYHVEMKPTDPRSKTRISYAHAIFEATNMDSGKSMKGELHPMWGSSGLHYAMNSALLGDGAYAAVITVHAPTFGRALSDKDLFAVPAVAKFHFKLKDGALTEVSEPLPN